MGVTRELSLGGQEVPPSQSAHRETKSSGARLGGQILRADCDILEAAVAFLRGIDGLMLPIPEMAEPIHAWALLRLARAMEDNG